MLYTREKEAHKKGYRIVVGVDEAGRGPLAGPVVAAACCIKSYLKVPYVKDSKAMTPLQRQKCLSFLWYHPDVYIGIGECSSKEIDKLNILQATLLAMKRAVLDLSVEPDYILVDGKQKIETETPCDAIIKGDATVLSIAAASVIAKEYRDCWMRYYDMLYPQYGFSQHKGYPTVLHSSCIEEYGISPIHRRTFRRGNLCNKQKYNKIKNKGMFVGKH